MSIRYLLLQVKEALDLRDVEQCLVRPGSSMLEISMGDGSTHVFRGDNTAVYGADREREARDWAEKIEARIAWCVRSSSSNLSPSDRFSIATSDAGSVASFASASVAVAGAGAGAGEGEGAAMGSSSGKMTSQESTNRVHIAGYLMKKSHNKYQGLQVLLIMLLLLLLLLLLPLLIDCVDEIVCSSQLMMISCVDDGDEYDDTAAVDGGVLSW